MFSPSRILLQIKPLELSVSLKPKEGITGVGSSQRLVQSCVFCFPLASLTAQVSLLAPPSVRSWAWTNEVFGITDDLTEKDHLDQV